MRQPPVPRNGYAGDEHFLYIGIDRFIEDVLLFSPLRCDQQQLQLLLEKWFQEWDGRPVGDLRWVDDMVERCTVRPRPKKRYIPARVRQDVMRRDNWTCVVCGATDNIALDHIKPYSRGGQHARRNLQVLCRSCNSRKQAKTMEEWRQHG
jgi:hypothetical protein